MADLGCNLVLAGRHKRALQEVATVVDDRTGKRPDTIVLYLADPASVGDAVSRLGENGAVLDVLINNGAMYLGVPARALLGRRGASCGEQRIEGTFLLTQGLLPVLQRSTRPDIVTIGSVSGLLNAPLRTEAVSLYTAKQGQAALAGGLRQMLAGTPSRSICIHPPHLEDIGPDDPEWDGIPDRPKGDRATNRDVVQAVVFALTRPRHITLASPIIDADAGGLFGGA